MCSSDLVAQLVTDQRHGEVVQRRHHDPPQLADLAGPPLVVEDLHEQPLALQVIALGVLRALDRRRPDLGAAEELLALCRLVDTTGEVAEVGAGQRGRGSDLAQRRPASASTPPSQSGS